MVTGCGGHLLDLRVMRGGRDDLFRDRVMRRGRGDLLLAGVLSCRSRDEQRSKMSRRRRGDDLELRMAVGRGRCLQFVKTLRGSRHGRLNFGMAVRRSRGLQLMEARRGSSRGDELELRMMLGRGDRLKGHEMPGGGGGSLLEFELAVRRCGDLLKQRVPGGRGRGLSLQLHAGGSRLRLPGQGLRRGLLLPNRILSGGGFCLPLLILMGHSSGPRLLRLRLAVLRHCGSRRGAANQGNECQKQRE